jgi:hypothetical protein
MRAALAIVAMQPFADRRWLEVDDAVHVAALSGRTYQLARDGDEVGRHAAEVRAWELIARLGLEWRVAPHHNVRALAARERPGPAEGAAVAGAHHAGDWSSGTAERAR